jgi:hypothetical protein
LTEVTSCFWLCGFLRSWSLGLRQLDGSALTKALAVEDEPHVATEHTGLTGAEVNVRVYRALLERQARR